MTFPKSRHHKWLGCRDRCGVAAGRGHEHQDRVAQERDACPGSRHRARGDITGQSSNESRGSNGRDGHPQPAGQGRAEHRGKREEVQPDDGADPDRHELRRTRSAQCRRASSTHGELRTDHDPVTTRRCWVVENASGVSGANRTDCTEPRNDKGGSTADREGDGQCSRRLRRPAEPTGREEAEHQRSEAAVSSTWNRGWAVRRRCRWTTRPSGCRVGVRVGCHGCSSSSQGMGCDSSACCPERSAPRRTQCPWQRKRIEPLGGKVAADR